MRFDSFRRRALWFSFVIIVGLVAVHLQSEAAVVSWSGGGADQNWTTDGAGGNWSGDATPGAADTAVFTHVAGGASAGVVTNVVPSSHTVHTLSYQLDTTTPTAFFHGTEIAAGQTLLVTDGLNVAPYSVGTSSNSYNGQTFVIDVAVVGTGSTLQVGNTGTYTASMIVGRSNVPGSHHSWSSYSDGKLDLSALGSFVANVSLVRLGHGIESKSQGRAELTLAASNLISATTIETGRGMGSAKIFLGQDNVIRADTFHLNIGKGSAGSEIRFQSGLVNPVLNLSGLNNAGVDLAVSYNRTTNTGGTITDVMDLSGGTFNATIAELVSVRKSHFR